MPTIAEVRSKFPQYNDLSDQQLGDALYKKFYSDMPRSEYDQKLGLSSNSNSNEPPAGMVLDPTTGAMVDTKAVAQQQNEGLMGKAATFGATALEAVPILGGLFEKYLKNADPVTSAVAGERLAQFRDQNPKTAMAADVSGAVGGMLPAVALAPEAFGAGSGGLLARSVASGLSGGAISGADTAIRTNGDMGKVVPSAGLGMMIGAAAPGVSELIGKGASAIAQKINAPSAAEAAIGRAASADAISPDSVGPALSNLGNDAMVMDLGPNLQRQAGALAATPGKGQQIVRSAIDARGTNAGARVADAADNALGSTIDTFATSQDIMARRAAAASPLYEAAYAKPVPFTADLEETLKRPSVAQALREAQKLAADEGIPSQQWFANVADDGAVTIKNTPDVRQLDLTKRALDDVYTSAKRAGNDNKARIVDQLRKKITSIVDDAVPEYAQARAAYSGPAAVLDAMDEGQNVFKNTMTPNELQTRLLKMDPTQKEAFLQGARSQIADVMGTARNDALAARSLFDRGYNKEKLGLLVGKDQADQMLNSLTAEKMFTKTRDIVTGNSETAARTAAMNEVQGMKPQDGIVRSIDLSRPQETLFKLKDKVIGAAREASLGRSNEELARMLTSGATDSKTVTEAIKAVQSAAKRGEIARDEAVKLMQSLSLSQTPTASRGLSETLGLTAPSR